MIREPDKPEKGTTPQPYHATAVTLVSPRVVAVEIPNLEKERLAHRTAPDGSVRIHPAISLTVKLEAADGARLEQTVHATINSLPSPDVS